MTVVQQQADGRFYVETAKGTRFLARTIFVAGGVGSFQPRALRVEGIDRFLDTQFFYRVKNPAPFAGKNLVIVGGGDSALDWSLNFAGGVHGDDPDRAESVILVHRRDGFKACAGLGGQDEGNVRGLPDAVHGRPGDRVRREATGASSA